MAHPAESRPVSDNPCLSCLDNCCERFEGLKVTRREYLELFADHADELSVDDHGQFLQLSSNAKRPCRHYREGSCAVYDHRPVECALFPYTIEDIRADDNGVVTLAVHSQVHCPIRDRLRSDAATLNRLVRSFVEDAFGTAQYRLRVLDPIGAARLKMWRGVRRLQRMIA